MSSIVSYFYPMLIQAITETMPVSSSMHLLLYGISLEHITILHLCTSISAALLLRKKIYILVKHLFKVESLCLITTTIFQAIIYLILPIPKVWIGPYMCFISGIILIIAYYQPQKRDFNSLSFRDVPLLLIFQTFGLISGFSRLGSVISATRFLHFKIESAWIIGILLGIPLSICSSLVHTHNFDLTYNHLIYCFACVVISYIFYNLSNKIDLRIYGIYKILFGICMM